MYISSKWVSKYIHSQRALFLADDHLSAVYKTRQECGIGGGGGGGEIMATVICWRSGVAPELAVNLGILAEVWMIDTLIRRPTTSGASDGPPASTRSALPIHWCTRILIDSTFYRSKQRVWSTHIAEVVSALSWLRLYWFRTNCNPNRATNMKEQFLGHTNYYL